MDRSGAVQITKRTWISKGSGLLFKGYSVLISLSGRGLFTYLHTVGSAQQGCNCIFSKIFRKGKLPYFFKKPYYLM